MTEPSELALLRDSRLTPHALSASPAWLWRADGTRILWANAVGAAIFGAASVAAARGRAFDLGQPSAAQVARLAAGLADGAPPRLERLRGFGAGVGRMLTCQCTRALLADGTSAVLIVATEQAGPELRQAERVRRLIDGLSAPVAAFADDGTLVGSTKAGQAQLGKARSLPALGAQEIAERARADGRAAGETAAGPVTVWRIGSAEEGAFLLGFGDVVGPAIVAPAAGQAQVPESVPKSGPAPAPALPATVKPIAAEPPSQAPEAIPDARADSPAEPPVAITPAPEEGAFGESDRAPVPPPDQPAAHPMPIPAQASAAAQAPASLEHPDADIFEPAVERRHPLRFVWQMDAERRFTLGSDEFLDLIGPEMAAPLGRPWPEIAARLGLDPEGEVERAVATRHTWSGVTLMWPVTGSGERLPIELSGLPVFDRDRTFRGYRGFGVCRDLPLLARIAAARHRHGHGTNDATPSPREPLPEPTAEEPTRSVVVPFPGTADAKPPILSANERTAFQEIGRRLQDVGEPNADAPATPATVAAQVTESEERVGPAETTTEPPAPIAATIPDAEDDERAPPRDEPSLLDRLPGGVLVYRFDQLLYANPAFLAAVGYPNLQALVEAGGLDALYLDGNSADAEHASLPSGGRALTLAGKAGQPGIHGRLETVDWMSEPAQALILTSAPATPAATPVPVAAAVPPPDETALRQARAEARTNAALLDIALEGVLVLDADGRILSANRGAERLFDQPRETLAGRRITELLKAGSERLVQTSLERLRATSASSALDPREVVGVTPTGREIALNLLLARLPDSADVCAVVRDIDAWKRTERELTEAKRVADQASAAKSAFLAKISHEIRTPLNAIIGFSEVMMAERFGPIENERYRDYLRDIHTSGEHLVSLLNDLLDLSKIEAGKLDLNFASIGLNDLTQQCVAIMQAQAAKERIIIRTSLSPKLPLILADARSVRQIVLNLLSNSIKFTGVGGQVIVSSALNDNGRVVLRVRDTGAGMSEQDLATALEPFRQLATSARWGSGGTGLGLPLTKALAEANHAQFSIKSAVNAGTLVEIAFEPTRASAE